MPAHAEADLVIDAGAPGNRVDIESKLGAFRTLFIHNRTTNGNNLRVILSDNLGSHDIWILRPGEWRRLLESETAYYDANGLWSLKKVIVTQNVAGQTITNWDYEYTTWDKDKFGQRYQ